MPVTPSRDWFEHLTGFSERDYASTQRQLVVDGEELVSTVNHQRYGIGELSLPTLVELRSRVNTARGRRTTIRCLVGDVRSLHAAPEFDGALFQVASQFNLLELTSPDVCPEDGVARYARDPTQGPACAIAAGAATIYRNYCVPIDDQVGQTSERQLDALTHLGAALPAELDHPVSALWAMRNGYALCTKAGLQAITDLLANGTDALRDTLGGQLAIGLHRNIEVTDLDAKPRRHVSQAFCAALPVAYSPIPQPAWTSFARLVLAAAYEATLLAAVEQAASGGSNTVLLTRLGGGVFGNADAWIDDAIEHALSAVENAGLDVRLVSFATMHPSLRVIAERCG